MAGSRRIDSYQATAQGGHALAVSHLVTRVGATLAGISVLIDRIPPERRAALPPVTSIATCADLPPDNASD